jgi:hypothetical protein
MQWFKSCSERATPGRRRPSGSPWPAYRGAGTGRAAEGQRFKLSARERTARESRECAIDAAVGARTGGIWATLARGGAGNRLVRAKSASAAPTLATTAALNGRIG